MDEQYLNYLRRTCPHLTEAQVQQLCQEAEEGDQAELEAWSKHRERHRRPRPVIPS